MCGFAGFYNHNARYLTNRSYYEHILEEMNNTLYHRGPDENGIHLSDTAALAHSRLSIIDLTNGTQPITRNYFGHSFTIVHNGEIYNAKELKDDLITKGHPFSTTTDTEVLLRCFLEYGPDFISLVDGIFATVIFDEKENTIHLFRDPFGVKPLFYTNLQDTLIFSSEIKGIFTYPGIFPSVDTNGLNEIFSLGPARTPGNGVYHGIHEVKPGCYITCNRFGLASTQYFRIISQPHYDSYDETIEKTSFLVTDAIKRQMVSDVPLCTLLSGGVDSSIVTAVCAEELKKHGKQLTTFSFDFEENHKYFQANDFQPSEDRPYVEMMVRYLDTDHHYLLCNNQIQADGLYASVDSHDLPCMADIDSSLQHFCKGVKESCKVTLTGECADEVFGGYPWFHKEEMLYSDTFPWMPSLEPRQHLLRKDFLMELHMEEYVANAYHNTLREISVLPEDNTIEANRRRIGYLNLYWFMATLLNRMDRASSACGLEARVPFADKTLVQYIFNTPWDMKARDGIVKNLLRQAAVPLLPREVLFRKKSPYPKTYHPDYTKLLSDRLKEVIHCPSSPILTFVDKEAVLRFLESPMDYGKPFYGQLMASPQMIAYLLQINYWLESRHIAIL